MTLTREPLQVVEIVEPRCSRTFGVAPCLASGDKCWNTDATCKFVTALDLTDSYTTRFVAPAANRFLPDAGAFQPGEAIPALSAVDTAPTVLNVGAGNDDLSPLGARSVATVAVRDFPSNDVGYDPYLSTRAYDPVGRGSFWSKWLVRNPFHTGYALRIYDGFFGDALSAMIKREYSIEKIDASRSSVRITAKDILRKVTDNNPKAPKLSNGALSAAMTIGATSFQAAGVVLTDYPSSGWVRINDEIIAYTATALVGTNVQFTGLTRGDLKTTAAAHSQNDRVQQVLAYVDQPFSDIIYDLLTVWGEIDAGYINKPDWDAEYLEWRELYRFTAYVSDPEEVQQLVGELCQQALAHVWWDERVQKIILRAQRPNFAPAALTQEGNLIADSVVIEEVAKDRASQVYVYYNPRTPVLKLTDRLSFANAEAFIDIDRERQYGEAKVKEIFCRWVNTGVIARSLGNAYLLRFRDVRRHISFNLAVKDIANFWTGEVVQIRHFLSVDFTGAELVRPWLITSAETVEQGGVYRFMAEDNESGGILWQWVADTDPGLSTEIGCWVDADGTDGAGNVPPFAWV
jgi:hypothetical protein